MKKEKGENRKKIRKEEEGSESTPACSTWIKGGIRSVLLSHGIAPS
jgi:hypothetical protein